MSIELNVRRAVVALIASAFILAAAMASAPRADATPASAYRGVDSPPYALAKKDGGSKADVNDVIGYEDRLTWNNKIVGGETMHEKFMRLAGCNRDQKCHTRWVTYKPPTAAKGVGTRTTPNWAGQEFIDDAVDQIGLRNRCAVDGPQFEKTARNAGCTKSNPWGELHPLSPLEPASTVQGVPTMMVVRVWRECAMDKHGNYVHGAAKNGGYTNAAVDGRKCTVDPIYERMIPRSDHGEYKPAEYFYSQAGEMKGSKAFSAYEAVGTKRRAGVLYGDCMSNPDPAKAAQCTAGFQAVPSGDSTAHFKDSCVDTGLGKPVRWTKAEMLGELQWRMERYHGDGWPRAAREKGTMGDRSTSRLYEWVLGDDHSMKALQAATRDSKTGAKGVSAETACRSLTEWLRVAWGVFGEQKSSTAGYSSDGGHAMIQVEGNFIPGRLYLIQFAVLDRAENILKQEYQVMMSAPQPGCIGRADGKVYERGHEKCKVPLPEFCTVEGTDKYDQANWRYYPEGATDREKQAFEHAHCKKPSTGDSCKDASGTERRYPAGSSELEKAEFRQRHCGGPSVAPAKVFCNDRDGNPHDITGDPDGLSKQLCPDPPPIQCIDMQGRVHEVPFDQTDRLNELCPVPDSKRPVESVPPSGRASMQAPASARTGVPMTTRVATSPQQGSDTGGDDGGDRDVANSMWFPRSAAFGLFNRQAANGLQGASYENGFSLQVTGGGDPFQRRHDGFPGVLADPIDGPTWAARVPLMHDNTAGSERFQSRVKVESRDATLRPRTNNLGDALASHNVQYSTVLGEGRYPHGWRVDDSVDYQWLWQRLTMDTCDDGVSSRYPHFNAVGNGCRPNANLGSGWSVRDAYTFPATDAGVPVEMTSIFAQRENGRARVQLDSSLVAHNKIVAIELWAANRYASRTANSHPDYMIPAGSIPAAQGEIHACKPTITKTITVQVFDRYDYVQVWRYVFEWMPTLWRIEPDGTEVWGWNERWDWVLKTEYQPVYRDEQREIEVENPDCPNPNAQAWDVDPVTGNPQGPVTRLQQGTYVARYVANGPIASGTGWGMRAQTMIDPGEQWIAKFDLNTNREFEQVFRGRAVG